MRRVPRCFDLETTPFLPLLSKLAETYMDNLLQSSWDLT